MKSLVLYYSWTGNTEVVAKEIAAQCGAETVKIEEEKQRTSSDFGKSAMAALFGFKSKIKPFDRSLDAFDTIFLGCPVWAGRTVPAVNAALEQLNFSGKKVYLFLTQGDGKKPQKVFDSMAKRVRQKGGAPLDNLFIQAKMKQQLQAEAIRPLVSDWANKIKSTG